VHLSALIISMLAMGIPRFGDRVCYARLVVTSIALRAPPRVH